MSERKKGEGGRAIGRDREGRKGGRERENDRWRERGPLRWKRYHCTLHVHVQYGNAGVIKCFHDNHTWTTGLRSSPEAVTICVATSGCQAMALQ